MLNSKVNVNGVQRYIECSIQVYVWLSKSKGESNCQSDIVCVIELKCFVVVSRH